MPKDNKRRKAPPTISQEEFAAAQAEQRAKTARTVQAMESGMREHNQKIAEETVQLQKRNDNLTKALGTQSKRKESVRPSETLEEKYARFAEETVQPQKRNDNLTKALRTQSKRKESVRPSETLEEKYERFIKISDTAIQSRQALIDKLDARYGHRTPQRSASVKRGTQHSSTTKQAMADIATDRERRLQWSKRINSSVSRAPSPRSTMAIQTEPKPVEEEMFPPSFFQGSRSEDIPYLKEIWKRAPEDEREEAVRLYKRTNSLYANDTDRGAMKDMFYKVFVKNQNVHPPISLLRPLRDSDLGDMTNVFRRAQARIAEQSKELPAFLRDHIGDGLFRDRLTKVWYAVPKQDREVVGSYLSFQPEALEAAERKFINGENVKMPDPYEGSWGNSSKFIAAWNRPRPAPEPAKPKVPQPSFEERVQAEVDKRMAEHFGRQFEQHREDFAQRLKDFDSKNSKLVKQNQRIEREINEQKLLFGKQLADAESIQSQASARADRLERSLKKRKESAKRRQDEISDIRTRMDNTERRRKESTKRRQDEISELRKGIDDRFDSQSEEVSSLRRRMDNTELRRKESTKRRQDEISEIRTRMDNADQQTSKRQRRLEQSLGKQADEVASLRSRMDDHDRQREADRKESERRIEEQKNLTRRRVAVNAALGDLHFVDVNNPGMQIEIGNAMMRGSRKRFVRDIRGQRRLIPSSERNSTDVSDIFLSLLNSQKKPK